MACTIAAVQSCITWVLTKRFSPQQSSTQERTTLQHAQQTKQGSCTSPQAFFQLGGDAWKVFAVLWALTYIANEVVSTVWFPSDHSQRLGHHEAVLEKQYRKHRADR